MENIFIYLSLGFQSVQCTYMYIMYICVQCTYMGKNMHSFSTLIKYQHVHKYCLKPCLKYLQIKMQSCKKLINICLLSLLLCLDSN